MKAGRAAERYLEALERAGLIRPLDRHFASRLGARAGHAEAVVFAAAWVSHRLGQGHVCADLRQVAGQSLFAGLDLSHPPMPPLEPWCEALRASPVVGWPGDFQPLILDESGRLYLHRYFTHESAVAEGILRRADLVDLTRLRSGLDRLFPEDFAASLSRRGGAAGQKRAAAVAVLRRFALISGGPGTGKTTTVTKLLALLMDQGGSPRIALVAPTGKAAARLSEAVRKKKAELLGSRQLEPPQAEAMPEHASTLHRLLGSRPHGLNFRHNADNPLPVDVLVVDEASMIDLPLMSRVLNALLPSARLILLGDMHQLASVEAGQVFGDLCSRAGRQNGSPRLSELLDRVGIPRPAAAAVPAASCALDDSIAVLQESFRFGQDSGIGHLARAVNAGDAEYADRLFTDSAYGDIAWRAIAPAGLPALVADQIAPRFRAYLEAPSPQQAFAAFESFRVLCALREGPFGVEAINRLIEQELTRLRWIRPEERWYAGRPLIMTRNDYGLRLFNGDIGLIRPDAESGGALRAMFAGGDGTVRKLLPSRLPEHETVYAMTVHKSQGSE
ncbi:MAG: exodeoxyribonuclease V subunit alpha, partial [Methylotetracoccus sp.]|nr:exodeoxyribonuclease V subunit alpha [Methylotetracoccus sp.]